MPRKRIETARDEAGHRHPIKLGEWLDEQRRRRGKLPVERAAAPAEPGCSGKAPVAGTARGGTADERRLRPVPAALSVSRCPLPGGIAVLRWGDAQPLRDRTPMPPGETL